MFKIYQKYLISNFLKKFIKISFVFLSLVFILGILEEINFFRDVDADFFFPYFLTLLNAPITLFEIFPFILLISTQFFLYDLIKNEELNLLKKVGLSNLKIIKILFFLSVFIGVFNVVIYYNVASKLKFYYSDIKNNFSNDNKYLAMVTESGLWIKDEVNEKKYIIKSKFINDKFLFENIINEFDADFKLIKTIQSKKIDISDYDWVVYNPKITIENNTESIEGVIIISSNFNSEKINNLFSNISSFNIFKLYEIKNDYKKFGYSTDEITIQLLKLFTTPLFYGMFTIFSVIVMFNFSKNKSLLFHLITGVLLSVIIYYVNFIFNSLGNNGKIPVYPSIFFPLFIIFILSVIGLVNINEK
jgi:lipopolysaccharide export system permease protein|tara:strand:- start:5227 stop:6306 length:1080 start_codon:yes stop_codon:yes gene_type:complete